MNKYLSEARTCLRTGEVWYIEIDGRIVKLPTVKSGWVSISAAKNALRQTLNGKGDEYEEFLKKHVRFKVIK